MRFGRRSADVPDRSSGGGTSDWIKQLKTGDTRVRFLQEEEDWTEYWEHYNPDGFPFPCTNTKDCPGCNHEHERAKRATKRFATNVLREGYVEVFKLPVTLRDRLKTRSQRNGTLLDRDYTLVRSGSGLDTEYDYDQHERDKQDLSKHELKDIEELLQQAFTDAHPDYDLDKPEKKPKAGATQGPPPFDPPKADGDVEVTLEQLNEMRYGQIIALLEKEEISGWSDDMTKPELIEWIVEKYSS